MTHNKGSIGDQIFLGLYNRLSEAEKVQTLNFMGYLLSKSDSGTAAAARQSAARQSDAPSDPVDIARGPLPMPSSLLCQTSYDGD